MLAFELIRHYRQTSVQSPKFLDHIPEFLRTRSESLTNLLLHTSTEIQEPLQHLSIQEPEWRWIFLLMVGERTPCVEFEISGRFNKLWQVFLEFHEQVLILRRYLAEQIQ